MDTRALGYLLTAAIAIGVLGFPFYDRWIFRNLPPKERAEGRGAMTIEPYFSYVFGFLSTCLGLAALHSGVWLQRDPVALVFAIVCFAIAWFTFIAHKTVRVRWDANGIEALGTWYSPGAGSWNNPGPIHIAWRQIREVSPDPHWPERIIGTDGQEISLSFCRGRAALLSEAQKHRPDIFHGAPKPSN